MSRTVLHHLERETALLPAVEPRCRHFGRCGGCQLQHVAPEGQRAWKAKHLQQTLGSLLDGVDVAFRPAPEAWRYRNKMEFTFGATQGTLTLGLHASGSFWKIEDLTECFLLPAPCLEVLHTVRALAAATGLPPYYPRRHEGFFRYCLMRWSRLRETLLLCLLTTEGHEATVRSLAATVCERHPKVGGCYHGVVMGVADVARPRSLTLLEGSPTLDEAIGRLRLPVDPFIFLQPNVAQAAQIYDEIERLTEPTHGGTAWDLYCGCGLIACHLARVMTRVIGIEHDPHNVATARTTAQLNGVGNVEFHEGPVETVIAAVQPPPDCLMVDPPRSGLHPDALRLLTALHPRQFLYLSCNPETLAGDLRQWFLARPQDRLTAVRAYEMFPQTTHLEVLTVVESGGR